jgi:SH3-like domain-containing protein
MRFPIPVVLVLAWVLAAGGGLALAQNAPSAGTLSVPSGPPRVQPTKPPAAARRPIHKVKTPVVPAHGPVHPQKPVAAVAPAQALPPQPGSAAAPVVPQVETKAAPSEKLPDPEKPDGGPAKLPRFVSLRSDDVNMRAGPGTRYRIDWKYKRRDLPVEIEREFDVWRWVRDADGIQGWVHQATLMGRRDFIVQKADATMRSEASDTASAVAILKPGVIGRIRSCEAGSAWCEVQTGSYRGFLRRTQFWGVFPDEAINP